MLSDYLSPRLFHAGQDLSGTDRAFQEVDQYNTIIGVCFLLVDKSAMLDVYTISFVESFLHFLIEEVGEGIAKHLLRNEMRANDFLAEAIAKVLEDMP